MKKFIKIILMCLLACSLACLAVGCGKSGSTSSDKTPGLQYKTVKGEKYVVAYVAESDESDKTIVIPNDVDKIKAGAFENNATISKIVVPSNVKEIGAGAFMKMKALKELNLPYVGATADAVNEKKTLGYLFGKDEYTEGTSIKQRYNSSSDATYYLPKTFTTITVDAKEDYELSDYAFDGCKYISSFTLSGKITAIGKYAFNGCYNLESLVVPDTVVKIGDYAFVDCTRLTGKASNEEGASLKFSSASNLKEIGDYTFMGTKLSEFYIPEGVEKIGSGAFSSKVSSLKIDDQSEITKIVLPNSLKEIKTYTFYFATKLTTVRYGTGLNRVWANAFNYCDSLKSFDTAINNNLGANKGVINFANTIMVGANAFSNCGKDEITYTITGTSVTYEEGKTSAFINTKNN